jgi:hypothetical protein
LAATPRQLHGRSLGELSRLWTLGPGETADVSEETGYRIRYDRRHCHATFQVDGQAVHVDRVQANNGGGPYIGFVVVLVYADGVLVGGGSRFGCALSISGTSFPVTALVGNVKALSITDHDPPWIDLVRYVPPRMLRADSR